MASLRDQYWGQYCATPASMTGMMAQSALSAGLWMIRDWEEWLTESQGCYSEGSWQAEEMFDRNLTKFRRGSCNILYVGRNSPMQQHWLKISWLEISFAKKDLGAWRTTGRAQSAARPCSKGSQLYTGLSKQERSQQVRRSNSSSVFNTCETISAPSCPLDMERWHARPMKCQWR